MSADTGLNYIPNTPTTPEVLPLIADRPLYTDRDRTHLIEEGEAGAEWIVAGVAGQIIGPDFARDLNLEVKDGKIIQGKGDGKAVGEPRPVITHEEAERATQERIAAEKAAANDEGVVQPEVFAAELAKAQTADDDAAADAKKDAEKERKQAADKAKKDAPKTK